MTTLKCATCKGDGTVVRYGECLTCDGEGGWSEIGEEPIDYTGNIAALHSIPHEWRVCPECGGMGEIAIPDELWEKDENDLV